MLGWNGTAWATTVPLHPAEARRRRGDGHGDGECHVTNVNDTPDAVDDAPAAFAEDSTNNAIDVLANDTDPDNLSGPANAA